MKPVKILSLLLATVIALSACTSAPPVQETPPVTESTAPSTEPVTEPPPTTSPTEPTTDFTGVPYTSAQKSYYDDLRLPFDEALTFYIQVPEIPAKMKFSIANEILHCPQRYRGLDGTDLHRGMLRHRPPSLHLSSIPDPLQCQRRDPYRLMAAQNGSGHGGCVESLNRSRVSL